MEEGEREVAPIEAIGFPDITPQLARESGFLGIVDLLKGAKHGKGENIYLIRFHYLRPDRTLSRRRSAVRCGLGVYLDRDRTHPAVSLSHANIHPNIYSR